MKLIDCAAEYEKNAQGRSLDSLFGSLKLGRSWSHDQEAQEVIIAAFQRMVDNKYFMLRNMSLEGLDDLIPLVLVGSPGVWVLYPSGLKGVYRAQGEIWEKIDDRHQSYKAVGENILTKTALMAKAVEDFLTKYGIKYSQVGAVLVFTNPGIHVETVRPVVRIVLIDALNRFIAGIVQGRLVYTQEQVQKIVDLFTSPPDMGKELATEDAFSLTEQARAQQDAGQGSANLERIDTAFSQVDRLPFSSRQWIILIVLILINVFVLIAFVIFILFSN